MPKEKKLPKNTLRLWQIRIGTLGVLLTALLSVSAVFTKWMFLAAFITALLFIVCVFIFLPLYIDSYKISFDDTSISVSYGIIFRTTFVMPYPRMVYIKLFATPLTKALRLSGVVLKAARGSLIVPEIEEADALLLMEYTSKGVKR